MFTDRMLGSEDDVRMMSLHEEEEDTRMVCKEGFRMKYGILRMSKDTSRKENESRIRMYGGSGRLKDEASG